MKIGILTFQDAINYGAILQTYALQKAVDKLPDVNCAIINYSDNVINDRYRPLHYKGVNGLKMLRTLLANTMASNTRKEFDAFKRKYLNVTPRRYEDRDLSDINNEFDYVIVGSDQVWNVDLTNNNLAYFLNFAKPSKRIAYAASFGIDELDGSQSESIKPLLTEFKSISVREKNGVGILNKMNLLGRLVLDPTFLLDKHEWKKISKRPSGLPEDYILVYTIGTNHELLHFASQLAEKHKCKAYFIGDSIKSKINGVKALRSLSPEEWIYAFLNAKIIVTNSFHGVAFSINFNKSFWVYPSMTNYKDTNSRIESILDLFDLKCCNKLMSDDNSYDIDKLNEKLNELKESSLNYIKESLYD